MRSRLWLVLILFVFLALVPSVAMAEELDGNDTQREELALGTELRAAPDTPMSMIRYWFQNVRIKQDGSWRTMANLMPFLRNFFTHGNNKLNHITPAVGIVFIWWGSRKVIRIIMRSFRKGKINA